MAPVVPGVHLVKIPVPLPLKYVNCYLARGEDGWHMLDTGLSCPPAFSAWQAAFQELGIEPHGLRRIYVSHGHADHIGLARWFQALSGATIYMLDVEWAAVPAWADPELYPALISQFYGSHGMPARVVTDVVQAFVRLQRLIGPVPEDVQTLRDGDEVPFGPYRCRVIWTPGHSDGMFCLYAERDGLLFAADHVLPKITPNVSLWPECRPDPLADYLRSLELVRGLPVRQTFQGHGPTGVDLATRAQEILQHHDERLAQVLAAAGPGRTAFDVTSEIFRRDLDSHQLRFAMSEALAHLEYLVFQGALVRTDHDGRQLYLAS